MPTLRGHARQTLPKLRMPAKWPNPQIEIGHWLHYDRGTYHDRGYLQGLT
jgi:hypothetical protein